MWPFTRKGPSGFDSLSTAEDVTSGIDATGLTAIITGASSGIGAETARVLTLRGVHVVMGVRNTTAGRDVKDAILEKNPTAKIDVMELDLSSMASVRNFAAEFNFSYPSLNLIINNAGSMVSDFTFSKDKIELTFATNHLGHFLMTDLLLDKLKKTAQESKREGRIVNISSSSHGHVGGIQFSHINDPTRYQFYRAYGESKLANILHANELARRLQEEGVDITVNSVHPGGVATKIVYFNSEFMRGFVNMFFMRPFFRTVQKGAATTCYVALHPGVKGVTGQYFVSSNIAKPSDQARDPDLAKKLWDFSFNMVGQE